MRPGFVFLARYKCALHYDFFFIAPTDGGTDPAQKAVIHAEINQMMKSFDHGGDIECSANASIAR